MKIKYDYTEINDIGRLRFDFNLETHTINNILLECESNRHKFLSQCDKIVYKIVEKHINLIDE